ncbi:MAG: hypothetical protein M3161_03270 [Actinomycetota bacterium]|nr:hypothetical protein [Actinomycetota bacterium]
MRVGRIFAGAVIGLLMLANAPTSVAGPQTDIQGMVDRLTLREKVGQLVMFSVAGHSLSATDRDAIVDAHLGGVILFADNYRDRSQLEVLTTQIQRAARRGNSLQLGALISVDQEGGVVKRFPDMPPRYSAPQMGEMGRTVAHEQGRATGRALRNHGVNVNLAPVADLDLPPNHVMRSRSFGSDPERVGRLVRAFARGLQRKRVAAVAKHFPGLGGATINTDDGRSEVRRTKRQLRRADAVPFRTAIEGGIRMVMVGHAIYVNDGGGRPASLNHYIATQRLRREFGFKGVAISDALESVAWWFNGNASKACRGTIGAGVDIALLVGGAAQAKACAARIYNAVLRDEITRARVDQAVERVLRVKRWLGLTEN